MTIREQMEKREHEILSPYASFSDLSKGRKREEEPCDIRTCFQRDRDRILHCKSFRRLKNKTQVFLEPEGDHYRTRMTHTLEVSQIARTIAKALGLNEDLTEAIALGHDLGHTPFGHSGEAALDDIFSGSGYGCFDHAEQSVRTVELIEKDGEGLNLSFEVIDGIRHHGLKDHPLTLEGDVVRLSDKIAYVNHDIDDALRAKVLREADIPAEYTRILGTSVKTRLNTLIHDVITASAGTDTVRMSEDVFGALKGMREYLFRTVYESPVVKKVEKKAKRMLRELFDYYMDNINRIPESYRLFLEMGEPDYLVISDYISGMTDQFAVQKYTEIFVPQGWQD